MKDTRFGPAVFISADMEGCASLVHWDEVQPGASDAYQRARALVAAEVNAAIEGALAAGACDPVVNDAHSAMRNLVGQAVDGRARIVTGRGKPLYMLEGIQNDPPAIALFIGYHGAIGDRDAVMGHTYSPRVIFECRLAGQVVGELSINAALAGHYRVPVALVSGDSTTLTEAQRNIPWAVRVETKRSLSYYAADCLSPKAVQEIIRSGSADAVRRSGDMRLFTLPPPIVLEIDTLKTSQADALDGLRGFTRTGPRTIAYSGEDMPEVYRALISIIHLGAAAA